MLNLKAKIVCFLMVHMLLLGSGVMAFDGLGDPKRGQEIYTLSCARCHGDRGDGNGPESHFLVVKPANFLSEKSRSKSDVELMTTIAHGVVFSPMHGWRDRLSQEEMLDVLSYIRFLAPFLAVAEGGRTGIPDSRS